jgi:ribosomal-protein-alanine N-acetyltransferase
MDFWKCLSLNPGVIIEIHGVAVGYLIYGLSRSKIKLINLAVMPVCRRSGTGSLLITLLMSKLMNGPQAGIEVIVREANLGAQMFFASHGFKWIETLHNFYNNTVEDAYRMWYCKPNYRQISASPFYLRAHNKIQLLSL